MSDDKKTPTQPFRRPASERDRYVSKHTPIRGVPATESWHEESTGVHTDPQVFRALKGLHDQINENKHEAARAHGVLKSEVSALTKRFDAFEQRVDSKLDDVLTQSSTVVGQVSVLLSERRLKPPSSEMRAVATETLATQVLAEQREEAKFKRALTLKVVGGIFSAGVVGAIIAHLLGGCGREVGEFGGAVVEHVTCPADIIDCGHVYICGDTELCINDDRPADLMLAEAKLGMCTLTPRHQGLCRHCCGSSCPPQGCNSFDGCWCP